MVGDTVMRTETTTILDTITTELRMLIVADLIILIQEAEQQTQALLEPALADLLTLTMPAQVVLIVETM